MYSADAKPERASNRLIGEKSPYLLQHSENPVDWYPWGEEAFQKAKKEDKPIFLSIGYATNRVRPLQAPFSRVEIRTGQSMP